MDEFQITTSAGVLRAMGKGVAGSRNLMDVQLHLSDRRAIRDAALAAAAEFDGAAEACRQIAEEAKAGIFDA